MTRTLAAVLSMFGPLLPITLVVLMFSIFRDPPRLLAIVGLLMIIAVTLIMRVYFAMWYARDKGRSPALGFVALFGLLGWLFLFLAEDRKGDVALPAALS